MSEAPPPPHFPRRAGPWLLLGLLLLVSGAIRVRLLETPLERDEGEYALGGQLLLDGKLPYAHLGTMKLPGAHLCYAIVQLICGRSVSSLHLGFLLLHFATALLFFDILRRLYTEWLAVAGTGLWTFFSLGPSWLGLAGHAENLVVSVVVFAVNRMVADLPIRAPSVIGWRWGPNQWAAALFFGVAPVIKQQSAAMAAVLFAYQAYSVANAAGNRWRRRLAILLALLVTPLAVTWLLLLLAGVGADARFWTLDYAWAYIGRRGPADAWGDLSTRLGWLWWDSPPACMLAFLGVGVWLYAPRKPAHGLMLCWLVGATLSISAGWLFRDQYFLLALPPWSAAVAVGAATTAKAIARGLRRFIRTPGEFVVSWSIAGLLVFVSITWPVWRHRELLLFASPRQYTHIRYGGNPFDEAEAVAQILREKTSKDATVVVFGSEPQIYYLAGRTNVTPMVYMYPMVEVQPYAERMQERMIDDVERTRPDYLVHVKYPYSWLAEVNHPPRLLPWTVRYIDENYRLVGFSRLLDDGRLQSGWNDEGLHEVFTTPVVEIYARNPKAD